jgi:hypothetical protein
MLRETCVAHVAPKQLGPQPLGAKAVLFSIIVPTMMWVACAVFGACPLIPPASLTARWKLGASVGVARPETGWDPCGPNSEMLCHGPL